MEGHFEWSVLCLVFAAVCDGLDGHVARMLKGAFLSLFFPLFFLFSGNILWLTLSLRPPATSQFGAELDSLCDLVDFGVSPCLVMYIWARQFSSEYISDMWLWGACLFFCVACAFRLARFNVTDILAPKTAAVVSQEEEEAEEEAESGVSAAGDSHHHRGGRHSGRRGSLSAAAAASAPASDLPPKQSMRHRLNNSTRRMMRRISTSVKSRGQQIIYNYVTRQKFFQGAPAPVAGALCLLPMIWAFEFSAASIKDVRLVVVANLVGLALLMAGTMPTLSSKMLMRNPHKESHLRSKSLLSLIGKIVLVGGVAAVAYLWPWKLAILIAVVYVALLPVGLIVYRFCDE